MSPSNVLAIAAMVLLLGGCADVAEIAVESFFSVLTRRRIRRGVFKSASDFQGAIRRYIASITATPAACLHPLNESEH